MNKQIAYIDKNGLIQQCFETFIEIDDFKAPVGLTAIEFYEKIDYYVLCTKRYYKNNEFKELPEKPSNYHTWDLETEQWQEPENYQQLLFDEAASKVKQERQQLLATTDWTDTVSASTRLENYNAWQFYRQQLRDITTQEGYPFNVIWPTQPV
jgi:ribosomal protein S18 acetylase RimI-like enzyme